MNKIEGYNVAIVGATGLVGKTLIKIIEEERFPVKNLYLFASEKSKNEKVNFNGETYCVQTLNNKSFPKCDFIFLMTSSEVSKKYAKWLTNFGIVIDNSSAFRLNSNVPLIVPEINFKCIQDKKLIANPNCTTAICSIPFNVLKENFGIVRANITTFQAVSGSGKQGLFSLENKNSNGFYACDVAKTCIPIIGKKLKNGYTEEELKIADEMPKILNDYVFQISATCVRVPIANCHSASILITLKKPFLLKKVIDLFSKNDQLILADKNDDFPNAIKANNANKVFVGRIRKDFAFKNTLSFYLTSDNLRRGASYNAFKIMDAFCKK